MGGVIEKDFKKLRKLLLGPKYVWCADDKKYGLLGVYATKKAAERALASDKNGYKNGYLESGYGVAIIKRKVYD